MNKLATFTIAALLLVPPATMLAQNQDTSDIAVPPGKNYVYKNSSGTPQNLEVYLPANRDPASGKVPGVLLIHGGGWSGGNLEQFRYACNYFASRGLVAATINYRMLKKGEKLAEGESRKRICVTDAKSAIRWFKQHADEWGMDPKRLIIGGGSAGGHIAMLATLNTVDDPTDPKDIDTSVAAYLLFNPAFVAGDKDPDDQVDPLKWLHPGMAPALFQFGSEDRQWGAGSEILIPKLRELGNEATLLHAAGQKHGFFNHQPWADVALAEADRFLVAHGLLTGTCTLKPPASGEKMVPASATFSSEKKTP